jgi:hypothetical protein
MPDNPSPQSTEFADPNLIKPGDVVWLDSMHLTPSRGHRAHTWPHNYEFFWGETKERRTFENRHESTHARHPKIQFNARW